MENDYKLLQVHPGSIPNCSCSASHGTLARSAWKDLTYTDLGNYFLFIQKRETENSSQSYEADNDMHLQFAEIYVKSPILSYNIV